MKDSLVADFREVTWTQVANASGCRPFLQVDFNFQLVPEA